MAKEKPRVSDQDSGKEDACASRAELERRIATLEKSISELPNALYERHLKTITIVFGCVTGLIALCALLVTLMGHWSRTEAEQDSQRLEARVTTAAQESDTQTKQAIADMQAEFAKLAGESLKKAFITISNQFGSLDSQVIHVRNNMNIPLFPLFAKNIGSKNSGNLKLRLYSALDLGIGGSGVWEVVPSDDREFPFSYVTRWEDQPQGLSPQETWPINPESYQSLNSNIFGITNEICCKFVIFYDAEQTAEARFKFMMP